MWGAGASRFNLNLLECKYFFIVKLLINLLVLISTYWNVNFFVRPIMFSSTSVLISTYWNVNDFLFVFSISFSIRFNLNLLECKSSWYSDFVWKPESFNLNLLECKYYWLNPRLYTAWSFNLNLLECKFGNKIKNNRPEFVLISTYWNVNSCIILTKYCASAF